MSPGQRPGAPGRGSALLELVAVMDRLRSPGGCPWDARQTHASLVPHLLEEAWEVEESVAAGDGAALREELGDVLLQVVFHARIAQEDPLEPWDVDDVAREITAKLVRRHPHVFGDVVVTDAEQVSANWEEIKRREKGRSSVTEGVPMGQPALSLYAALVRRARRGGLGPVVDAAAPAPSGSASGEPIGPRLAALVREAVARGVDPEAELRAEARRLKTLLIEAERAAGSPESPV